MMTKPTDKELTESLVNCIAQLGMLLGYFNSPTNELHVCQDVFDLLKTGDNKVLTFKMKSCEPGKDAEIIVKSLFKEIVEGYKKINNDA